MTTNLISIIIPVYNVAEFVRQCLDSVINQTYTELEIIIVNDGSTDDSLQICQEYQLIDNRIQIINQQNAGLSAARNTGIDASNGDFILFVDSDDWIELETCELLIEKLKQTNADVVLFSYFKQFTNYREEKFIFNSDLILDVNKSKNVHRRIIGLYEEELAKPENADSIVTAWGKLYRAEIMKSHKIYFTDCKLIGTEDMLFNVYYFLHVKSIVNIHRCLYHYRKNNQSSLTSSYKPRLFEQWSVLYGMVEEYIEKEQLDSEFEDALKNRISLGIIGLGINELYAKTSLLEKYSKLKKILSSERYRKAVMALQLKYFPVHWKLFFFFSKYNMPIPLMMMLLGIKKIINK